MFDILIALLLIVVILVVVSINAWVGILLFSAMAGLTLIAGRGPTRPPRRASTCSPESPPMSSVTSGSGSTRSCPA